jgi:hypothetical protein
MDNTIVQVPISKSFRDEMVEKANSLGFSSLQDLIRFTLTQIKNNLIVPSMVSTPTIPLSPKAVARYDKMVDDIESGKEKTISFENTQDMIKYLDDNS